MSYTGTEIFNQAIAIIDELSDTGAIVDSQISEYKNRAPYLLDMWQKESPDIYNTIEISRKPMVNLLGERFKIEEHIATDRIFESNKHANSIYFKVDNEASVYIEEYTNGSWVNATGFYAKDDGAQTAFTGLITVPALTNPAKYKCILSSTGDKTRIRFSGNYYYLFYNFALYEAAFPICARVPEYGEYVKYTMPSNFDSIAQITEENPKAGLYHKWENNSDLFVNYYFDGVLKITYKPNPTKITSLTQTLEVSESSSIAGAYYLAEHFAMADQNSELAQRCKEKYAEIVTKNKKKRPLQPETIQDVYCISNIK